MLKKTLHIFVFVHQRKEGCGEEGVFTAQYHYLLYEGPMLFYLW